MDSLDQSAPPSAPSSASSNPFHTMWNRTQSGTRVGLACLTLRRRANNSTYEWPGRRRSLAPRTRVYEFPNAAELAKLQKHAI